MKIRPADARPDSADSKLVDSIISAALSANRGFRSGAGSSRRGGGAGGSGPFAHEAVHEPDHEEDAEGEDDEIDALLDECAVVPVDRLHGGGLCGVGSAGPAPRRSAWLRRGDVADFEMSTGREKSVFPIRAPIGGMRMSFTSEETIFPNAPPIISADGHVHDIAFMANSFEFLEESVFSSLGFLFFRFPPQAGGQLRDRCLTACGVTTQPGVPSVFGKDTENPRNTTLRARCAFCRGIGL